MSMVSEILEELWNTEYNYKGVRVNIFGIPRFQKYSQRNIRTTIDRLKRKGLIEKELSGIILSKHGKEYVRKKFDSLKQFERPTNQPKERKLLVMFDVPTEKKGEREWLRWHLKKFGYIMIQQSVWVGPAPLPKEFSNYLKEIKLDRCIKTFKLEKPYK
ncbi:MAG: CRISPR-associated endonuclease Cas2 [Candidatus Nomurabacteria bacterium]|nr:CRISPR-associated endonuclease Cas2 [Candidatus Nomurabacteria bacterium]